jgi:uncharacterized SAM-binding protein YcdF (DUF218 family)
MRFWPKSRVKRGLVGLGALFGLCVILAVAFPQQVLCVDSGEVRGDVIVVLGGGSYERPLRAAELFLSGAAPRIIVSGVGDAAQNKRLLMSKGVPGGAIEVEGNSLSTKQNAQFSIPLLRALGARRVIIVTTWYHSRRALHTFQHYAPDISFYSGPAYFGYPRAQWSSSGIRKHIRAEYLKLPGYWLCYGVCPF